MQWMSAGLVGVALALLSLAACGGKSPSSAGPSSGTAAGTASPSVAGARPFPSTTPGLTSIVPEQRISLAAGTTALLPGTISLDTGVPVQLSISNSGGPCLFYVASFLQGLLVQQGQTAVVTFTPPALASGQGTQPSQIMGCENEVQRQGKVTLTATNPSVSPGSAPLLSGTPQPNEHSLTITVADNGILPNSVTAPYDTPLNVVISNQSGPCLFHFGDMLRGLLMPAAGVADVLFTIPSTPPVLPTATATPSTGATAVAAPASQFTVGCVADTVRSAPLSFGTAASPGTPAAGAAAATTVAPSAGSAPPPPVSPTSTIPAVGGVSATGGTATVTAPGAGATSAPGQATPNDAGGTAP